MITKILRNTTAADIIIVNIIIMPGESVVLEPTMWAKVMQQNGHILSLIESGAIVINDGSKDLSPSQGIDHLYLFQEKTSSTSRNFSYNHVKLNEYITIEDGQQMRVYQECRVDGDLNVYGEIIVKDI